MMPRRLSKKRMRKGLSEEGQRRATFMRACVNFKSMRQNWLILLFGYLRQLVHDHNTNNKNPNDKPDLLDKHAADLYHHIPLDIVHFLFEISYNHRRFGEGKLHWERSKIHQFNNNENENAAVFDLDDQTDTVTLTKYEPLSSYVLSERRSLRTNRVRKVWRLRVSNDANRDALMMLCIFVEWNNVNRSRFFSFQPAMIDGDPELICVRHGDVISMLFVHLEADRSLFQMRVNDKVYPEQVVQGMTAWRKYKLCVELKSAMTVQFLNDRRK
eukprot:CAMPEP_0197042852 /NCGR_PEP_ID=MMETSP1384-20130603/19184_1 /TAXON_ID=29189 /ORGANISM="Ammonia sp." /LENGTH=270 /DNA_ID=CAMNT_0042474037 /DNA_START=28 /DNA_END=840 /DNA_ORIENTATION=-